MLFDVMFEEGLVIFVSNEGKCCVVLTNFVNFRAISNATSLKKLAILTLRNDVMGKMSRTKLASGGSFELFLDSVGTDMAKCLSSKLRSHVEKR